MIVLNILGILIKSHSWTHKYVFTCDTHFAFKQKNTKLWLQEGELREVSIEVGSDCCSNLGRRATLTEKLLGLSTTVFEDGLRIMVASIIPNTPVNNQKSIKIGTNW